MAQQQVVIMQQPQAGHNNCAPLDVRDWSTGLCACCEDCGVCCYAYCCYCCFLCDLAGRARECACGPCCLGSLFLVALRTKIRTMFGVRGTICRDCCTIACCEFCATTQMMREMKFNGL